MQVLYPKISFHHLIRREISGIFRDFIFCETSSTGAIYDEDPFVQLTGRLKAQLLILYLQENFSVKLVFKLTFFYIIFTTD